MATSGVRVMALFFVPFLTRILYFDARYLLAMLSKYFKPGECSRARFSMPHMGALDCVDIYAGKPSDLPLGNLITFLDANRLDVRNVGAKYEMAIAVGFNSLSGVPVDIPYSAYPWASHLFGVSSHPGIWDTPVEDAMLNPHRFQLTCNWCKKMRTKCVRIGVSCDACESKGMDCQPNAQEATHRRREFAKAARDSIDVLCALHQYTINLVWRNAGETLMSQVVVRELGEYLDKNVVLVRNVYAESLVKTKCDAFQEVAVNSGVISHVDSFKAGGLWGFESGFRSRNDKLSVITPHFGLSSPVMAYSLIDNALQFPGEVFYVDVCILTKAWEAVSARIMILASVMSRSDIRILVGWKYPK